jgi:vacuolar-type H+-ATPase subunit I/STV1
VREHVHSIKARLQLGLHVLIDVVGGNPRFAATKLEELRELCQPLLSSSLVGGCSCVCFSLLVWFWGTLSEVGLLRMRCDPLLSVAFLVGAVVCCMKGWSFEVSLLLSQVLNSIVVPKEGYIVPVIPLLGLDAFR